jgi:hypothetical protein
MVGTLGGSWLASAVIFQSVCFRKEERRTIMEDGYLIVGKIATPVAFMLTGTHGRADIILPASLVASYQGEGAFAFDKIDSLNRYLKSTNQQYFSKGKDGSVYIVSEVFTSEGFRKALITTHVNEEGEFILSGFEPLTDERAVSINKEYPWINSHRLNRAADYSIRHYILTKRGMN